MLGKISLERKILMERPLTRCVRTTMYQVFLDPKMKMRGGLVSLLTDNVNLVEFQKGKYLYNCKGGREFQSGDAYYSMSLKIFHFQPISRLSWMLLGL